MEKRQPLSWLLVVAAMLLTSLPTFAANLLVNPGFEANSGHAIPNGWTYFSPPPPPNYFGNYWVEQGSRAHSGSLYWKEWGALYNPAVTNVAGIYQDFGSSPGSRYQASGWFYTFSGDRLGADCYVWVEVSFLGSSSNLLALYKSDAFNAAVGLDSWFQYQVTNACDVSVPVSVGDPYFTTYAVTGSVSQLVAPVGTTKVRYRFAYAQAGNQGGSAFFDDAVLDQVSGPIPPVISSLVPLNMIFVNPTDGITFNVNSPSGFTINNSAIRLVLNGQDVSSNLVITGSASNKNVSYAGLQSNQTYNASITVTDAFNFSASANTYFETTWVGVLPYTYLWEAEDFDFGGGLYLNNPELCSAPGNPNCYFGKVGVEGVDEHNLNVGGSHLYRPDDLMGTAVSGDYLRKNLFQAGRLDYKIDPFNFGEWINYTRDWPNSTNWIVARVATEVGFSGSLSVSLIDTNQNVTELGTFSITSGRGWSTFDFVYLRDTNGFPVNVVLNGKATLRVTSGGNLLPGFFMLVPAQVDLPRLFGLQPTGTHPFEPTNALSFTVTTEGATFPAGGIQLLLDGIDVSSQLVISGSSSSNRVVYPGLLLNAKHEAIIAVTNSLGHGIRLTNRFDTFSQTNYQVEAEDFDFDAGQYVTPWVPEAYGGLGAATNIDFQHIEISPLDERYPYRTDGIPQDLTRDYLRDAFIDVGARDYDIAWFGSGDWVNYTRVYPTGKFFVYGRFPGLGNYTNHLDLVVSGAGTSNQVTRRLGTWSHVGRGYNAYDWVPLTSEGSPAPVVVDLNGLATLRLTTSGNNNPNFFMLVPAGGISLASRASGANLVLSIPTQAGATYRVFYREDLLTGSWQLLTTVLGDGTVKSITDPAAGPRRFYKVTSP